MVGILYLKKLFRSHGDQLVPNLLDDDFFFVEHGGEYDVIVGIGGFIQPVVEDQLFRVTGHTFLGRAEIEVDDWIERGVVGYLQLCAGVVVDFPVAELNQVTLDAYLIIAFVLQFRGVSLPILEAASGQLCCVVPVKVEGVEDVRVLGHRVLFPRLLDEDEERFAPVLPHLAEPQWGSASPSGKPTW